VAHGADWSGPTRAFADAASLLAARGYETCLVAPAGSEAERCLGAAGHDVIGVASGGGWMRAGWRLQRVIAARLTEVLFVHDDREHLAAAVAIRMAGRGAVVRRTAAGERLALGREGRLAMRLAATGFVFAHADDMRGTEPPRGALAALVTPPGVAAPAATPRPSAAVGAIVPDAPRLVVFAGADRRREMLVALRALALLAPRLPALRATVFSPVADADAVRIEAAALGVAERLSWRATGSVRDEALAGASLAWVIASADDAVFALLDALRHGVPVLSERTPLCARYVEDGVTGLLRHRSDEAQWASEIAAVLAHAERADTMRSAARQSAARWPLDAAADGWLQAAAAARDRTRWTA
jgi:glycosyltransferase involved in cell wall biosynthesis